MNVSFQVIVVVISKSLTTMSRGSSYVIGRDSVELTVSYICAKSNWFWHRARECTREIVRSQAAVLAPLCRHSYTIGCCCIHCPYVTIMRHPHFWHQRIRPKNGGSAYEVCPLPVNTHPLWLWRTVFGLKCHHPIHTWMDVQKFCYTCIFSPCSTALHDIGVGPENSGWAWTVWYRRKGWHAYFEGCEWGLFVMNW